jgi:hypothetical protein
LLGKVFHENEKLNLELESSFSEMASLPSAHDDISVKSYDRCTMIMVNYADMWLIHSHVAGLLDSAWLKLRKLKSRSTLLGACTSCPVVRSDLETAVVEIIVRSERKFSFYSKKWMDPAGQISVLSLHKLPVYYALRFICNE